MSAYSDPFATFAWSVIQGNLSLVSENLEMGPNGSMLIIKGNTLTPSESVELAVTAKYDFIY